mmetsp:Transcript_32317/g.101450  ORF Transcript_32317/g.101450 Transcript_32317/m.101450 type:complete len:333 (-) Transcript_32317:1080-2078(-)
MPDRRWRRLATLQRQLGEARAHRERGHRPITLLPAPHLSRVERGEAGPRRHVPGEVVDTRGDAVEIGHARARALPSDGGGVVRPEARHQPGLALQRGVVPVPVALARVPLPLVRFELQQDRLSVGDVEGFAVQSQADELVVHLVEQDHVRRLDRPLDHLARFCLLRVEDDRVLPLMQLRLPHHHHHRPMLRHARTELVDGRSELGEHAPTRRPCDHVREVADHVTLERALPRRGGGGGRRRGSVPRDGSRTIHHRLQVWVLACQLDPRGAPQLHLPSHLHKDARSACVGVAHPRLPRLDYSARKTGGLELRLPLQRRLLEKLGLEQLRHLAG